MVFVRVLFNFKNIDGTRNSVVYCTVAYRSNALFRAENLALSYSINVFLLFSRPSPIRRNGRGKEERNTAIIVRWVDRIGGDGGSRRPKRVVVRARCSRVRDIHLYIIIHINM